MTKEQVKEKINSALIALYEHDQYLLEKNGSERSIAHCLANHLKCLFEEYDVDCEYNVNLDSDSGRKEIGVLIDEMNEFNKNINNRKLFTHEDEIYYYVSVYPDIIVHKRKQNDENFLVFELKKSTSTSQKELDYDQLKLEKYTSSNTPDSLKYTYGVFVNIHTGRGSGYEYNVKLYQNGRLIDEGYTLTDPTLP